MKNLKSSIKNKSHVDTHRVVTCSMTANEIKLIDEIVLDGWNISRTDTICQALDKYIFKILGRIFTQKDTKDFNNVFNNTGKPSFNYEDTSKLAQLMLGTPRKIYNDRVYEFRFRGISKPQWVCIGTIDELPFLEEVLKESDRGII